MIDEFDAQLIINSGTAGGMTSELEIFDMVISAEACYHDVAPDTLTEFHPWMKSVFFPIDCKLIEFSKAAVNRMQLSGKVIWGGRMVIGELFIMHEGRQKICDEYTPLM